MDGQARSMDAKKPGRLGGWTRIGDWIRRRKREVDRQNGYSFWW